MSHLPLRKQNNCLNCGTRVIGRFCHNCGQENVETKESVWHFVVHFFNDFTHFDGKFFTTLKDLLFKPGYLSGEYMKGKRVKYLNPVRMYLFTSFLFFLVFFAFVHIADLQVNSGDFKVNGKTREQIVNMKQEDFMLFTSEINNGQAMTRQDFSMYLDSVVASGGIYVTGNRYKDQAEYDSLIKAGRVNDNWFVKKLVRKEIEFNKKYNYDRYKGQEAFVHALTHNFPQILFLSLPFAALFLKLLYIRHKEFYYVSHSIFTLHFYIFVFIMMLVIIGVSKLENFAAWNWLGYITGLLTLTIFFYLYKAMRNFYQQRRGKTVLKYFLFLISFSFLLSFLFIAFLLVSFFQV